MILEKDMLPRKQNIESCYTGTYDKYREKADKLIGACETIYVTRDVVTEHSNQLNRYEKLRVYNSGDHGMPGGL